MYMYWRFDTWYSKLLGVVLLLIVVFLLFHIQKIEVTGIEMLTQQEVSDWVKSDTMSGNSLYVLWNLSFVRTNYFL